MNEENKKELTNKGIFIFGVIIIASLIIPFLLYVFRVISKITMTLIFIAPALALFVMIRVLKKTNRM